MIKITGQVVGDARLIQNFNTFPDSLLRSLVKTITRLTIGLQRYIKQSKLSGQVLKNRTGTLRRSINYQVTESTSSVTGKVGTNLSYAHRQEYGFKGVEPVRAHLRTIKQAWGRPIAPVEVHVKAFTRKVDYPEHSFLRSALADSAQQIREEIKKTIDAETKKVVAK